MGVRFQKNAFGRGRAGIRSEGHPRLPDLFADVVLRHHEVDRVDPAVIFDHQIDRGILRRFAAHARDFGERLAGQRLEFVAAESDQQNAIGRAGQHHQVFPRVARRSHFLNDARADRGVLQTPAPLFESAFLHPRRHGGIESGRAGGVGVHVGGDSQTVRARGFDFADDVVHLRPIFLAGRLEVIDLGVDAGLARDRDQLIDRLQQLIAFAAHMRDVHSAVGRGSFRQRDHLVGLGVRPGRVDERGRDAERPVLHRFSHERAHLLELRTGRRAIGTA